MFGRSVRALAALALVGAMASGCRTSDGSAGGGSTATGGSASNGKALPGKRPKIAISVPAASHGWTAGVIYWAKQAMELHPEVDWTLETAKNPEEQVADVEILMAKGIDGLVILATESGPLTPVAKRVAERGIFIVNVDRGFTAPVADVFLEGDNVAFGHKSAEYMVKKLGGTGKILVLRGIRSTVDTDRFNAAMKVFQANPGIQILDVQFGEWNRERAANVMQSLLLKHKQVDAVWAQDDDMALGAEQAIREAGRQNEMWMLGGAGMNKVVARVMKNDPMFPADITYPPSMIATGVHLAASSLVNGKLEKVKPFLPRHMKIDVELITPENAQRHYFPESVY